MFIEPTITWVPSGFSRYIWLDTKIVFKKTCILQIANGTQRLQNVEDTDVIYVRDELFSDPVNIGAVSRQFLHCFLTLSYGGFRNQRWIQSFFFQVFL